MNILDALSTNPLANQYIGKELAMAKAGLSTVKELQKAIRAAKGRPSKSKAARRKERNQQVGEKPGSGLTKVTQYRTDGYTSYNGNALVVHDALAITRATGTHALNTRLRDIIYLSGIKVCITVEATLPTGNDMLYFNLALISSKNRGALGDGVDFFRSYEGGNRQMDFDSATLNALDRHCLPINSDEHVVHFHKRVMITQANNLTVGKNQTARVWTYEVYVPVKRQIRFEDGTANSETKFNLCHWGGRAGDSIAAANTPLLNAYKVDLKMLAVFKEPTARMYFA